MGLTVHNPASTFSLVPRAAEIRTMNGYQEHEGKWHENLIVGSVGWKNRNMARYQLCNKMLHLCVEPCSDFMSIFKIPCLVMDFTGMYAHPIASHILVPIQSKFLLLAQLFR